jgi:hypothetical protein
MANDKAQSSNEINAMTTVKNQILHLPKAESLIFKIYVFL